MATQLAPAMTVTASTRPSAEAVTPRYLFGPVVDFLCLGGSSLLILPLLLLLPAEEYAGRVAFAMMIVAHFINHPHFAHSYQIFYDGFADKALRGSIGREMQLRFLFAGLVAPALLVAFLLYGILAGDAQLLGYGANLMALAVGWHYVKQGYGMLMVDAALKRRFFDDRTKTVLLVNCYTVWIAAWLYFNGSVHDSNLWGLKYYTFGIPVALVTAGGIAAFLSSALAVAALAAHWRAKGKLPFNGVMAYLVSLYLWLLFIKANPLWVLVVPALHSLQYLVVVWRYRLNYESAKLPTPDYKKGAISRRLFRENRLGHMAMFVISGIFLGFLGFWLLPLLTTVGFPYDRTVFPGAIYLFAFWIGINVHHYFMDNVMWRRGNPDTRRYLFG